MSELRPFNDKPLNQLAKRLLKPHQEPHPLKPYALQLVLWLIQEHPQSIGSRADKFLDQLEDHVSAMLVAWKPENAQAMLDQLEIDPEKLRKGNRSAQQVADELLERLHGLLLESQPSLRDSEQ